MRCRRGHNYNECTFLIDFRALGTIPLSTDEHAVAMLRLGNAMQCYEPTTLVRNFAKRRRMNE